MTTETDDLVLRLHSYAQNNEMIDQHFTESGRGLNEAADTIERLQRGLAVEKEELRRTQEECRRRDARIAVLEKALREIAETDPLPWAAMKSIASAALSTAEEKP